MIKDSHVHGEHRSFEQSCCDIVTRLTTTRRCPASRPSGRRRTAWQYDGIVEKRHVRGTHKSDAREQLRIIANCHLSAVFGTTRGANGSGWDLSTSTCCLQTFKSVTSRVMDDSNLVLRQIRYELMRNSESYSPVRVHT
jgi:hypothetical protein